MSVPFVLSTRGRAEIPHTAKRAVINVSVKSQGQNKASVSDEVVTTAQRHMERLLRELSPSDSSPEAKAAAPLAHYFVPYTYDSDSGKSREQPREYKCRIDFDIRIKHFAAMNAFGAKLSALPHTEIKDIDWILTAETWQMHQSELRKTAARNALEQAQEYCDALGSGNLRPVELKEVNTGQTSSLGGGLFGARTRAPKVSYPMYQSAAGPHGRNANDGRDESDPQLEFTSKEVRMSMDVTITFHAEQIGAKISSAI